MAEDRIIVDGRSYISSVRAAQLFGYTKDYVGQLARAGKIQSQLIGRSWYVDEDSIRNHKLTVHYTLTKPKKPRKKGADDKDEARYVKSEKPMDEIDISEAINILNTTKEHPFATKSEPLRQQKVQITDQEEYDLFPKPVKTRSGDVLVKSDFVYEPDPPPSYVTDDTERIALRMHRAVPGAKMDGISIRTSVSGDREGLNRTATKERVDDGYASLSRSQNRAPASRALMDGIVTPSESRYHESPDEPYEDDEGDVEHGNGTSSPRARAHHGREDEYDEDRPSRILPILGALIIFLILTILYLVV